jgi:hypothetical protein
MTLGEWRIARKWIRYGAFRRRPFAERAGNRRMLSEAHQPSLEPERDGMGRALMPLSHLDPVPTIRYPLGIPRNTKVRRYG